VAAADRQGRSCATLQWARAADVGPRNQRPRHRARRGRGKVGQFDPPPHHSGRRAHHGRRQAARKGIGLLVFNHSRPGGHDYDASGAMVVGRFFWDTEIYNEVWSQVAADRYSDCTITVTVGPIFQRYR
jgi:hypothetical protein